MSGASTISSAHAIREEDGLLFACLLDGAGGGEIVDWTGVTAWRPEDRPLWVHLNHDSARARDWLKKSAGVPDAAFGALLAAETRPRSLRIDEGQLVILRGVNLNEGAEPEDMVAVRMWVEKNRIISIRHERLLTPREVLSAIIDEKHGPCSAPALFAALAERLAEKMNALVSNIEDRLLEMEEKVETTRPSALRGNIAVLRQECVALRRYLAPQREALSNLQHDAPDWIDAASRASLRETADRTLRYLEDLDAARDRSVVVLDELSTKMSESMNKTMYAISIVATIFMPLSFLTGLLGINIGGMPGVENTASFWIFCVLLLIVFGIELYILKRMDWM